MIAALLRRGILVLLAGVVATAAAHAVLATSSPEAGAVVSESPAEVHLTFTEGVEVDFSDFWLVRMDAADVDPYADDAQMRLNGRASAYLSAYLSGSPSGEGEVPVEAAWAEGTKSEVVLSLSEPLAPGHYVVMWRALSVDTHGVNGHVVFTVVEGE
ncbi:MAG TPA: copper resistance protein CopC [Trueperaceae bacterium]|nr:copper resistance protein CopC [Trueperaceae bacterium]